VGGDVEGTYDDEVCEGDGGGDGRRRWKKAIDGKGR
jgi:hypothetical protein